MQEIPDLGYALICTSPNGRYLGGVHASDNSESFDAIVWDVEAGHTEVCRVRITEACSTLFPVFSMDGEYMYFQAGFPISKLYSLSTRTGKLECVFCCKDGMSIRSLSAGAAGVIMVVQGEDTPAYIEYIPVGVKNRCVQTILDFRFVASAQIDKIYASWLNDENIIIWLHHFSYCADNAHWGVETARSHQNVELLAENAVQVMLCACFDNSTSSASI